MFIRTRSFIPFVRRFRTLGHRFTQTLSTTTPQTPPLPPPTESHTLRTYQQECIDTCLKSLQSRRRIAVSLATGGGKTVIFTHLLDQLTPNPSTNGNKTLILVHRKELADQAITSISKIHPDYKVELDMAKYKPTHSSDVNVIVASVPTLSRSVDRLELYDPSDYKAIIIDECHHGVSESYLKVLRHFKCDSPNTDIAVIGFSATLKRHDRVPLKKVFDEVVFDKGLKDLITDGYLSDFTWAKISASFKLNEVEIGSNGDYKLDSLAEHVNTDQSNELVLKTFIHFQRERSLKSTLFFCVNIQHMVDLSQLFRTNGFNAQFVAGSTVKLQREKLINGFRNGEIPILMNCGVFTEGTDIPNIDSIFMVRPTKSKPLLIQMLGRGLRLHSDKTKCLIVDFVDASMTGIHLMPSLKGAQQNQALKGLFPPDLPPPVTNQNSSETIDGKVDYVEVANFEGYDDLMNRTAKIKDIQQDNIIKRFKENKYQWIQVRRNCWVLRVANYCYYKIEQDFKKNLHVLSWVTIVHKGPKIHYPKSTELYKNNDIDLVFEHFENDFENDVKKQELFEMGNKFFGAITTKQKQFLFDKLTKVAMKSPKIKLNIFENELDSHLSLLSKNNASLLIFAYTISGSKSLQMYITNTILRKKRNRENMLLE